MIYIPSKHICEAILVQGRGEAIARDMNRHSAVVLQGRAALEEQSSKDRPDAGAGPTALATDESEDARRKRNRSELEDLREEAFPAIEELKIHNPRRYFEKSKQVIRTDVSQM